MTLYTGKVECRLNNIANNILLLQMNEPASLEEGEENGI